MNDRVAPYLEDTTDASYLSSTRKAVFFRSLTKVSTASLPFFDIRFEMALSSTLQAFPEVLDLLASADKAHGDKIGQLREALAFLCSCVVSIQDQDAHLHTSVHEWVIGPLAEYLTLQAEPEDRENTRQQTGSACRQAQLPDKEQ